MFYYSRYPKVFQYIFILFFTTEYLITENYKKKKYIYVLRYNLVYTYTISMLTYI